MKPPYVLAVSACIAVAAVMASAAFHAVAPCGPSGCESIAAGAAQIAGRVAALVGAAGDGTAIATGGDDRPGAGIAGNRIDSTGIADDAPPRRGFFPGLEEAAAEPGDGAEPAQSPQPAPDDFPGPFRRTVGDLGDRYGVGPAYLFPMLPFMPMQPFDPVSSPGFGPGGLSLAALTDATQPPSGNGSEPLIATSGYGNGGTAAGNGGAPVRLTDPPPGNGPLPGDPPPPGDPGTGCGAGASCPGNGATGPYPIPEPGSLAMLASGLLALLCLARARRARAPAAPRQ